MNKVLTVGVFDFFHLGHLLLFKNAKKYGDYLIVAVQNEDYILKFKPNAKILYSTEQRVQLIKELRTVDEVVLYQDVGSIVKNIDFDIFAVGEDQNHSGFQEAIDWCKKNGKKVVRMKRTPGICSSQVKEQLEKLN